jgi:hypothetical protein
MPCLRWFAPALAALALARAGDAAAILIRPDRDDEEYLELATRYPTALQLGDAAGAGVLVAPRWILTAARAAAGFRAGASVAVGGRPREIEAVVPHPGWQAGSGPDLALVLLRRPVDGLEPTPVHREADEAGKAVRIVGAGATGRIGQAGTKRDGKARAAINTVDRVSEGTLGVRLKGPEDASDLQGALGPGDTGAPAFFEVAGRIVVAGIASRTEDANGDGIAGSVGDWEVYTRVSAFAAWIDAVIAEAAAAEAAAVLGDDERR